jgi:hypothetical protein
MSPDATDDSDIPDPNETAPLDSHPEELVWYFVLPPQAHLTSGLWLQSLGFNLSQETETAAAEDNSSCSAGLCSPIRSAWYSIPGAGVFQYSASSSGEGS